MMCLRCVSDWALCMVCIGIIFLIVALKRRTGMSTRWLVRKPNVLDCVDIEEGEEEKSLLSVFPVHLDPWESMHYHYAFGRSDNERLTRIKTHVA